MVVLYDCIKLFDVYIIEVVHIFDFSKYKSSNDIFYFMIFDDLLLATNLTSSPTIKQFIPTSINCRLHDDTCFAQTK